MQKGDETIVSKTFTSVAYGPQSKSAKSYAESQESEIAKPKESICLSFSTDPDVAYYVNVED